MEEFEVVERLQQLGINAGVQCSLAEHCYATPADGICAGDIKKLKEAGWAAPAGHRPNTPAICDARLGAADTTPPSHCL